MTENQKLREAFEAYMRKNGLTDRFFERNEYGYFNEIVDSTWTGWKACAEALALPTADHLPNAGKMINGLTQSETYASASVSGLTAASVGERDAFEHDLSKSPFEFDMDRWPDNAPVDWPGSYKQYHVQCAWDAWQARAALSAGDAVDAQRYRWIRKQNNDDFAFAVVKGPHFDVYESPEELDAAIDAAMRKGQL